MDLNVVVMRNKINIALIILTFHCSIQAQQIEALTITGSAMGQDRVEDIQHAPSGNLYVTGYVKGSTNNPVFFGEGVFTDSVTNHSFYVAKYNANLEFQWVYTSNTINNYIYPQALTIDQYENIYITGYFNGSARLEEFQADDTTLYEENGAIFIAQFDSSGQYNWIMQTGGENPCRPFDITLDDSDQIYIGGRYSDTAYFGKDEPNETILTSENGNDVFVSKYSSNRQLIWARAIESKGNGDRISSVNTDKELNVYISGNYDTTAILKDHTNDSIVLTPMGTDNGFIAKFSEEGALIWAKNAYETGGMNFHARTIVRGDKLYSHDSFVRETIFGKDTPNETILPDAGLESEAISIYDLDGNLLNITTIKGGIPDYIEIDSIGNIYIAGHFYHNEIFFGIGQRNTDTLSLIGNQNPYIAKMSPEGEHIWALRFVAPGSNPVSGISSDSEGNIFISGHAFADTLQFYHYDSLAEMKESYDGLDFYISKVGNTFNHAPVVSWQGDTIFQEDFQGTDTLFFLAEEVEEEEGETITYTIDPDTSGIIDISLDETEGHLHMSSKDNQYGTQTFTVTADDGQKENYSTTIPITITVNPVNDKPIIESANSDFQISPGETLTLSLDDFTVNDVDNTYPDDFVLYTSTGDDFTVDGNTITPESDFTGTLNAQVYVYDGTDSSDVFDIAIEVTEMTSTNSSMADQILVFPNPVKNVLNLKISLETGARIEIIDLQGTEVFQAKLHPSVNTLDLGHLPKGYYMGRIVDNDGQQLYKIFFIKE